MATQRDQPTSRLRSQAKLVFGGALATGLQVGLVQCVMLQKWSPLLGALIGSAVYGGGRGKCPTPAHGNLICADRDLRRRIVPGKRPGGE